MPRIYEVPTHLQVEDTLIGGLTPRQLLRLLAGASLAYGIWDQGAVLPPSARLGLASVVALGGVLIALLQPGGRPLDQWLFAALCYALQKHQWVWCVDEHDLAVWPAPDEVGAWADLAPPVGWAARAEFPDDSRALGDAGRTT